MDEIEILKKIQNDCIEHDMCKKCTYYDGSAGCILHSSPIGWELDQFDRPMTCNDCIHESVCYRVGDGISPRYASKCGDFIRG